MSFDISQLGGVYTQPNEKELLVKAVLSSKTIALIKSKGRVMTGVKSKSQLTSMDTDAVFQDGAGCGFTPSGTTGFSLRSVEVGDIKVQESLCPKTLEKSFQQLNMIAGSTYDQIIWEKEYTELKAAKISDALEVAVWQGDKASGSAQLNRFDGYIKIIDAASNEIVGNTAGVTVATGITVNNVIAILEAVNDAIPTKIRYEGEPVIFLGYDVIDLYLKALKALNLIHYKAADAAADEVILHGTRTKLIGTPGLNLTKRMFGGEIKNFYYATDLLGEEDRFSLEYAKEAKEVRYDVCWKSGVQVAFPEEIVSFKLV